MKMKREGSQPFERAVVYEMGRQCPIGGEIELIMGMMATFPEIHRHEAKDMLILGMRDRFDKPEKGGKADGGRADGEKR